MIEVLLEQEVKNRIEMKRHTIMPITTWQGEKRKMQELERYKPGTKKSEGYKPKFDT